MSLEAVLSDQSMDFHNFAPRSGLAFVLSPPLRSVHSRIEINDSSSVVLELMGESEQTVDSEISSFFLFPQCRIAQHIQIQLYRSTVPTQLS